MKYGLSTATVTLVAYTILGYALTVGGEGNVFAVEKSVAMTLPHIIAITNLVTLILLQLGYYSIRRRRVTRHAVFMGSSFVLITLFLILYVFKVATLGPEQYRGPEPIRLYIYLPALIIHLGLSIASVPLVFYNALTGLALRGSAGLSHHRKTGRIAYPAWTLSLALGLIVYVMLRLS